MKKEKLLVVSPTYWPEGSGGTLATHLIVDMLSKFTDLEITVLTGTIRPARVRGVKYIIDPFLKKLEKKLAFPKIAEMIYINLVEKFDIVYIVYAYEFIQVAKKARKKAIVHLHDYKAISPSGVVLHTNDARNDLLSLIRDSFKINLINNQKVSKLIANIGEILKTLQRRRLILMSDIVIAVSKRHAEILEMLHPGIKSKLRVIYNPPPPSFNIEKELSPNPLFVYIGGDSYIKGFWIILPSILRSRIKRNVKFIFANSYNRESLRLIELINKVHGRKVIHVIGKVPHDRLLSIYKRAWALLFPSITEEPLPYAIYEAGITKTIPIASRVGGVVEMLKNSPAEQLLVRPGDVLDVAEKINLVQELDPSDVLEIGKKVKEAITSKMNTRIISKSWKRLIEEVTL